MPKLFFASDLHLAHPNILFYEPNRVKLVTEWLSIGVADPISVQEFVKEAMANKNSDDFKLLLENHDNMVIQNWNAKVKPDDTVIFLGDFAFGDKKRAEKLGRQLNGNKIIILGNHDNRKHNPDGTIKYNGNVEAHFKACGFYRVSFEPIIISYKGFKIICSHEPYQKDLNDTTQLYNIGDFYSVFGHCHSKGGSFEIEGKSCCCCIDMPNMNLSPIEADIVIHKFKK